MKITRSTLLGAGVGIICLTRVSTTLYASPHYGDLPLSFERNCGQAPSNIEFLAHGNGYALSLSAGEATLRIREATIRMRLEGGRRSRAGKPLNKFDGTVNYLVGNDPSRWRTGLPTYSGVKYENVYRGIDVLYYGKQRELEYDFLVRPGARPENIRLRFDGARELSIDSHGDLVVRVAGAVVPLRFHRPAIYQGQKKIAGGYRIKGSEVLFQVSAYDHSRLLVIDPVLSYGTYLGGTGYDQGNAIAVDSTGAVYVAGYTRSIDFPTVSGLSIKGNATSNKIFVAKLNPTGNALVYSTYLGGSGVESAAAIAVDKAGNAYITGSTTSKDFPTMKPLQAGYAGAATFNPSEGDAFVAELNPSGSALLYSTFLGGLGSDRGTAIAVDAAGNAYITGYTTSSDFPLANPLQPAKRNGANYTAFIAKLNAGGSALTFSTYLGGGTQATYGYGIAIDPASNVYVTGDTYAYDFPVVNASQPTIGGGHVNGNAPSDAFVTKLRADGGRILYSTFLGGSHFDYGRAITVDASGNAFIAGETYSMDFPTLNAQQPSLNAASLYQSLDGGAHFSAANSGLAGANVTSILVDPTNSLKVYAATSDRGIFSSSDRGNTWGASGAGIQTSRVQALAAAGSPLRLYAGLGSATEYPVFRSTDGGATWNPSGPGIETTYIDTIVVDPSTPTTLYAGITNSSFFYKTSDGGDHWIAIDLGTPSPTLIWSIAIDPKNSANMYAATSSFNGVTAVYGVYKSSDGGVTWSDSSSGITGGPVYSIAIDPNTPSTLYAGAFGRVYQSTDSGATWNSVSSVTSFSFRALAIDPSNSAVYAGGYNNLYKSADGKTWASVSNGVWAPSVNFVALDPKNPSTVFMGIEAPSDMFLAELDSSGAPAYSTYLGGATWDGAQGVAVDAAGNAYVAGYTCSADFPLVNDLLMTKTIGCDGGFAAQFDPAGAIAYSTLLAPAAGMYPFALAVDASGSAYVTGWTGTTTLPVVGPLQRTYGGGGDAFVMKIKP